uniref:Uncharacterized protein n=1 Tax=Anguilla anguilla TaxID=7936 RepID=A0A0E9PU95_ANGAN
MTKKKKKLWCHWGLLR